MKSDDASLRACVIGLFFAASIVSGCNGAAEPLAGGTPLSDNSPSSVHSATTATTTYKVAVVPPIFGNLHGSYTPEPCWTVSPSPLPKYITTDKVSVSYTSDGCSNRSITITYSSGYGSDAQPCGYKIHYPIGGPFQYSIVEQGLIDCAVATAPPSKNYDELLTYGPWESPVPGLPMRKH
jgi:hypothetical protein